MKTKIINARVILNTERQICERTVIISDGCIERICDESESSVCDRVIDACGLYLSPGLLDTHTHGIGGFDFNTCTAEDMKEIIRLEQAEGVTGFLSSLVVENHETTMERLHILDSLVKEPFLGIHLEGPYLNRKQKAVMKEEYLRLPDFEEFSQF